LPVGSAPFVRRRCDCLASSAPFINIQTYLLTYLRLIQFQIQYKANFAFTKRIWRGGRINKLETVLCSSLQRNLQPTTATARAHNPEALGARRRELFHSASTISRRISRIPSRFTWDKRIVQREAVQTLFNAIWLCWNDVQALRQRKCRLFTFWRI